MAHGSARAKAVGHQTEKERPGRRLDMGTAPEGCSRRTPICPRLIHLAPFEGRLAIFEGSQKKSWQPSAQACREFPLLAGSHDSHRWGDNERAFETLYRPTLGPAPAEAQEA